MLSHLCPAVDLVLVQPHIPDPYLLHYQVFGSVLIRLPCCCLHSSPPCSSPSQTPPHIQEAAPGPQTENRLLLPPSAFLAHPHIHSVSSCAGSVGSFLIPVCLFTLVPLFQSQEQCTGHRRKVGPAVRTPPPSSSRGRPCPLSSHSLSGCTWLFMSTPTSPHAVNAGRGLSPACSVPDPCTCCVFQDVSPESLRAPVSPYLREQPPLLFL